MGRLRESEAELLFAQVDARVNGHKMAPSPARLQHQHQRLHTALGNSFLRSTVAQRHRRTVLDRLRDNKNSFPPSLLGIAIWNLAATLPPPDPKRKGVVASHPPALDELLVFAGLRPDDVQLIQSENRDPLLVLSLMYNLIDCRWQWLPQNDFNTARARLELCVQKDFTALRKIIDPVRWSLSSPFWQEIRAVSRRSGNFLGTLTLPGDNEKARRVQLHVDQRSGDSSGLADYAIVERSGQEVGRGFIKVEKELGRPGAVRVTHEKQMRFAMQPVDDQHIGTLAYWVQAETVIAVFGEEPGRAAPGTNAATPRQR
jgi:hypothetical protein